MIKKIISVTMCLLLVFAMISTFVQADVTGDNIEPEQVLDISPFSHINVNGVDIGTLRYNLRADGTATVIGRATGNSDLQITFPGDVSYLGVTYHVTEIGAAAFVGHPITMIDLSGMHSLVTIGDQAFRHHNLTELTLSGLPALTTIGSQAFRNEFIVGGMVSNSNLTKLTLNDLPSLTTIGNSAFLNNVITDIILTDLPMLPGINMVAFAGNSIETITVDDQAFMHYFTQLVFQSPAHRQQTTDTVLLFLEPQQITTEYNTIERLFIFTPDNGENFEIAATAAINAFRAAYPTPPSMSVTPLPWEEIPPVFQWYKDGVAISGETGATLSLMNLSAADEGDYHVVVTWNHVDMTWQNNGMLVATETLETFRLETRLQTQTVRFNPNGGIFTGDTQLPVRTIANAGTYAAAFDTDGNLVNPALPHPTRTGYTFGGWFDTPENANGITQEGRVLHTDDVSADADRTLFARWTRIMLTVTFVSGANGELVGGMSNVVVPVPYGTLFSEITIPGVMPDIGWTHTGWSPVLLAGTTAITESLTFTAQYERIMIDIIFQPGINGSLVGGTSNIVVAVPYGTLFSEITIPSLMPKGGRIQVGVLCFQLGRMKSPSHVCLLLSGNR